jgi:hypothetical protein
VYGEQFSFYDFNSPLALSSALGTCAVCERSLTNNRIAGEHSFDVVVADPPFLSEECMEKTIQTVKHLGKDKVIFCTGVEPRGATSVLTTRRSDNGGRAAEAHRGSAHVSVPPTPPKQSLK